MLVKKSLLLQLYKQMDFITVIFLKFCKKIFFMTPHTFKEGWDLGSFHRCTNIFMKSLKASICFILVACTHYLGCTSVIYTGSNWKPTILYSRFQSKVASQIRLSFFRDTFSNYSIKFLLKLAISLEDSCFLLVLFSCPKKTFFIKSA